MSFNDLDNMTNQQLVTEYILHLRGHGFMLSYTDYEIIEQWLGFVEEPDDLLVILSDVLPEYFARERRVRNLVGIDKYVKTILKQQAAKRWERTT